jgi:hypothetical protein
MYEDRLAKGGFLPYVASWCGRPDLAQKASTKRDFVGARYWGRTNLQDVWLAETNTESTQIPRGHGSAAIAATVGRTIAPWTEKSKAP